LQLEKVQSGRYFLKKTKLILQDWNSSSIQSSPMKKIDKPDETSILKVHLMGVGRGLIWQKSKRDRSATTPGWTFGDSP